MAFSSYACRTSARMMAPASAVWMATGAARHFEHHTTQKVSGRVANSSWLQRRFLSASAPTPTPLPTTAATMAAVKPPVSAAASSIAKKWSFMEWYEGHLSARPVVTKMLTGGLLWGIGDLVAQIVPEAAATLKGKETTTSTEITTTKLPFKYDYPRTARAVIFGFAIHAPTAHVHYNFLEWMTVRAGVTGWKIPVFKAFMEQFVYWSWISNSLYHGAMGAMQGLTFQQIYDRIADVLWDTQKAQWAFWIPIQLLNFQYIPVRHQLNVVLLTSIVWTALLSAWYPPDPPGGKIETIETKKQE